MSGYGSTLYRTCVGQLPGLQKSENVSRRSIDENLSSHVEKNFQHLFLSGINCTEMTTDPTSLVQCHPVHCIPRRQYHGQAQIPDLNLPPAFLQMLKIISETLMNFTISAYMHKLKETTNRVAILVNCLVSQHYLRYLILTYPQ